MQARVTAILVARSGATYLGRTLSAIAAQTRKPDELIAVDAGSHDGSQALLADFGPSQLVTSRAQPFGSAIERGLQAASPPEGDTEWLWLLGHDNAPEPRALEQLLGAVEIAPSVAIAGPKLMRWDQPDVIAEFGETLTRYGASIALVENELDQAQHDIQSDVLGVAAGGMLVRRSLFVALGGFDPGLPSIDASLDFSVRARLAGFRVVVVPGARVASVGGPEMFGRRSVSERRRFRLARTAQLHRRLVYAQGLALLIHWLSLVPVALVRSVGQLLAKRPGSIGSELAAAFAAAFGGDVGHARRTLTRNRTLGWEAIAPLRMPPREVRERRAQAREAVQSSGGTAVARASFASNGGLWVVLLSLVAGLVMFGPVLGAQSLTGGGVLPLSTTVGELWSHVGFGTRDIGNGFIAPSDPFAYVLAVLGSLTFWSPSYSVVLLFILSLPLAALGAWFLARRLSTRTWLPAIAAILWAVAPSLLASLSAGHVGAVIAHLLLPWLLLAALAAPRSWAASAAASLLLAAVAASAPVLAPALALLWLAWLFSHPARIMRVIGIPIPALALFAPLVVAQFQRGTPLALLAEPGVPVSGAETDSLHLAVLSAAPGLDGWSALLSPTGSPSIIVAVIVAGLLLPVGAGALVSLFVPGSQRAIPALVIALLGFATAVLAAHLQVGVAGSAPASIWPGAPLSLFWLGLVGALLVALDGAARAAIPLGVAAVVGTAILSVPVLFAFYLGTALVAPGSGRILPAVVTADAQQHPEIGTLLLDPQGDGGLAAILQRGNGTTLDDQSTYAATSTSLTAQDRQIAVVAGNLASRSGIDTRQALGVHSIGFVVLEPGTASSSVHQRTADALDGNPDLVAVGETDNGLLWRVDNPTVSAPADTEPNVSTPIGRGILIGQAIIFGLALLLGIPTGRRRRRVRADGGVASEPANTFASDEFEGESDD